MPDEVRSWPAERVGLREWLNAQNQQLAELYAGAVEMLFVNPLPGYTHFVCHAVREIGNRLPDVVLGREDGSFLDYGKEMAAISAAWRGAAMDDALGVAVGPGDALSAPTSTVSVPWDLAAGLGRLVRAHDQVGDSNRDRAQRLFEFFLSPRELGADVIRAKAKQWRDCIDWFVDFVHVRLSASGTVEHHKLVAQFCSFESPIMSLRAGFYDNMDGIDDILAETNRRTS